MDAEPDWTQIEAREARERAREAEERRSGPRFLAVGGFAAIALVFSGGYLATNSDFLVGSRKAEATHTTDKFGQSKEFIEQVSHYTVDDKTQIVVEGVDAKARNDALPLSTMPLETARSFAFGSATAASENAALTCLTQAVYYEAAFEPAQGRRAVAQVVLNRVRHPAYPRSVCGVVYQGHTRRTGCQFSFTCDGSLLRKPAPGAWREAEAIAKRALAGDVETSVGTATHYHADYVLPKWAFTLGKLTKIGQHIFYRFRGGAGSASALSARYAGSEFVPSLNLAVLRERAADEPLLEADGPAFTPGLTVEPHVTDRHAANDIGGRLDTTKEWRLSIPDPVAASSRLRDTIERTEADPTDVGKIVRAETDRTAGEP